MPLQAQMNQQVNIPNKKNSLQVLELLKLFFIKQWSGIGKHDYKAIGPREVDYNYYSTWEGEDRTFVMDKKTYEKFFKTNAIESLSLELRKYIKN